jgi:hypothetical protein
MKSNPKGTPRPSTPRRDRKSKATKAPSARSKSKILANLGAEDGRYALITLASRHPELVPEIEDIIRQNSAAGTFQEIADRVVEAIAKLTMFDLGRHDSADPLGYRDETEIAVDVMTETLAPFVEPIRRHALMGMAAAALVTCEGVLLGLYRAERQQVSELLEWIPDGLAEFADEPLQALAPARQRQLPGTQERAGEELRAFARKHLPEWKRLQK